MAFFWHSANSSKVTPGRSRSTRYTPIVEGPQVHTTGLAVGNQINRRMITYKPHSSRLPFHTFWPAVETRNAHAAAINGTATDTASPGQNHAEEWLVKGALPSVFAKARRAADASTPHRTMATASR